MLFTCFLLFKLDEIEMFHLCGDYVLSNSLEDYRRKIENFIFYDSISNILVKS